MLKGHASLHKEETTLVGNLSRKRIERRKMKGNAVARERGQGGDLRIPAPQALLIIQVMKKKRGRGNLKDRGPGLKEIKRRRSTGLAPLAHLLIIQVMKKRGNLKDQGPGLKEMERRRSTGQENGVAAMMEKLVPYHYPDSSVTLRVK